jgi:hypothetical protein
MPPTPQVGTPSSTGMAATLTSSSAITGASFGLGIPKDPQDVVSSKSTKTGFGGVAPQRIIYGTRGQIGGQCTYVTTSETTGIQEALGVPASDNGNIHMVITMAGHQISQFYGATVTSQNGDQAAVPLVIYFNGYQIPLSINAEPLFGGDYGDWAAPTDGAYYVPADYFPPNLANGKTDTAHDFRWRIRVEIDLGDPTNASQPFPLLASDTVGKSRYMVLNLLAAGMREGSRPTDLGFDSLPEWRAKRHVRCRRQADLRSTAQSSRSNLQRELGSGLPGLAHRHQVRSGSGPITHQ